MTLDQALVVRDNNNRLKGTRDSKGFYTTDIWILPSNETLRNHVIRTYLIKNLTSISLTGLENEDMVVWAVDTHNIRTTGLLIYKALNDETVV